MAGPWFTVHRSGDDWQTIDSIWISNGGQNARAKVQMKVELQYPSSSTAETALHQTRSLSE